MVARASPPGLGAVAAVAHGAPAARVIAAAVEKEPAAIGGKAAAHGRQTGAGQKLGGFEGYFIEEALEAVPGPLPGKARWARCQTPARHRPGGLVAAGGKGRGSWRLATGQRMRRPAEWLPQAPPTDQ